MYKSTTATLLALVVATTTTNGQTLPGLPNISADPFLATNLPADCRNAATGAFVSFALACIDIGTLTTVIGSAASNSSATPSNSTNNALISMFGSASFLNSFCSKTCLDAGDKFQRDLETVCGANSLLSTSLVPANATSPMTAANINNYIKNINTVGCLKTDDGSKFCEVEIFDYFKKNNVPYTVEGVTGQFLRDSNFSCTSCTKRTIDAASKATTWVDYQRFKPAIDGLTQVTAKCPATPANNTNNNRNAATALNAGGVAMALVGSTLASVMTFVFGL